MISPQKHIRLRIGLLLALCMAIMALPSHSAPNAGRGKSVYKKANCVGCHKWHGGGGGSYGGIALSLRTTPLNRDALILVVRCGRPATDMPYHYRKAYRGDNRECYGSNSASLGDATPPRAHYFLSDRDVAAVVDYVQSDIQGRGTPGYDDCVAFWGADARRCILMAQSKSKGEKK
jgi:mono/diheme cytochrome c family protein